MITRRGLAEEIDRLDAEIGALQQDKKAIYAAYREANGKLECQAAQAAIKRRQKYAEGKREEIEAKDDLVEEIFTEIMVGFGDSLACARRATHEGKADAAPAGRTALGNHNVGVVGAENTRTTGLNLPGSPLAASVDRAVA